MDWIWFCRLVSERFNIFLVPIESKMKWTKCIFTQFIVDLLMGKSSTCPCVAVSEVRSSEHSRWPRFHHHLTLTSWSHRQSNFGSMRRLFSISPEECIYFDDYLPKIIGTTVNPKIVYKNLCTGLLCNSATIYYFQVVNNKTAQAIED